MGCVLIKEVYSNNYLRSRGPCETELSTILGKKPMEETDVKMVRGKGASPLTIFTRKWIKKNGTCKVKQNLNNYDVVTIQRTESRISQQQEITC